MSQVTGNEGLMTARGYARHRGCTHPLVVRMVGAGRLDPALRRDGRRTLIDAAVADGLWPSRRGNGHAPAAGAQSRRASPHRSAPVGDARVESERRFWQARARREELRLAREAGELESRSVIEHTLQSEGQRVRAAVQLGLDRAALGLVHQGDVVVIRRLLRAAYRDALQAMDGAHGGDGQADSAATVAALAEAAS